MSGKLLVASHLSALFPSPHPITVFSTQKEFVKLLARNDSTPPQHASYSMLFHTPETGTILLRVSHGGLMLELLSLSTELPPLRFDFPAQILPSPSIVMWGSEELHVLAVTVVGSLYRIVLPVRADAPLWQSESDPNRRWYREYVIQHPRPDLKGVVQVQGPYCVALSMPNGSLLRLDAEQLGDDYDDDVWKETVFDHHSFLQSITSLLPTLHSGPPGASEIISMASHPQPTDIGNIWTLSRDRCLRLWTARGGCVIEKTLPSIPPGRATSPDPSFAINSMKASVLLPPDPQKLLCVFDVQPQSPYLLAFIPTESSSSSGGFFQLFNVSEDTLQFVSAFEASEPTMHCRLQDFAVFDGRTLYLLWDKQGQSMVEHTELLIDQPDHIVDRWVNAIYAQEAELTPAYLDEQLLSHGSMTDKFFEAIMRPGMFSPFTLQTAINQYTDAWRSLPPPYPSQLLIAYPTVGEQIVSVVGCTVQLAKDPSTGVPQYTNYWNALKRDWEGFIARCREVERGARWPLAIGFDPEVGVMVLERERLASVVAEDLPLELHKKLCMAIPVDHSFPLLDILWTIRTKLGPRLMNTLESRIVDIVHQEIAFPYADIIQDQADRSRFRDSLDEGLESWIIGRLQTVDDIQAAARSVLDIVGGFDKDVKTEDTDPFAHPANNLNWTKALTASYITASVHARYDLCLSLMTLLFILSDDLPRWEPSLLAEIFVVFRGIAMLRYVARQSAGDKSIASALDDGEDDVIVKLRNMNVSSNRANFSPTYSLVHRLIDQYAYAPGLPGSAHHFLDGTGLLQSVSPAHATKFEVLFCDTLLVLGYRVVAKEVLAWLPRTPGVMYMLGRLWLDEGRFDDAAAVMEGLAASFGPHNALSREDSAALAAVMPGAELSPTEFDFYLHASGLFKAASVACHDVFFMQLALSVSPPDIDTSGLWHGVIKGLTDLGQYEDAYTTLVSTPYEKLKRDCIGQLVYRMCEENAVEQLMAFNFCGLADEVEDALSFKTRNADPRVRPFYSRILYTWYVSRGDYRNAALAMYQRARKLGALIGEKSTFITVAEMQLEAYVVGINALSLIDRKTAWIVLPVTAETGHEPRKRRKLSKHIPEGRYALGKRDTEIVELADMQYEYALLSARLELVRRDPTLLSAGEFLLSPPSIVLRLAHSDRFNTAMATARSLNVDMSDLFGHLTARCLRLSHDPDAVLGEDTSDWLLTDKVSSWPGTPADRGWRYLRQSLEQHDGPETDYRYTKVTFETTLAWDRTSPPPPWLIHTLEAQHPEYLIRTCLRYEVLESALEHTLSLMHRSDARLAQEQPKTASATWLPYTLIDQVLLAAESQSDLSAQGRALQIELRAELSNRVKRVQKYSQSSR